MSVTSDLSRYYRLSPDELEKSFTPGWHLSPPCKGKRGGCKHFEHDEEFGAGRLRHLIRYVERQAA
jgi:hypothetical protein